LTVLAAVGSAAQTQAATIYVSTSGNDANDGLTWATAKLTVSAGLTAAVSGDQVWVAAGTYVGCITLKAGVALYGGFAGNEDPASFDLAARDFTANATILDGNASGSVVTSPSGATATTRIDGFTIRNGTGTLSGGFRYGGGIYCASSSPAIANNTITGNNATSGGGGVYCGDSSTAAVVNNTITGNTTSSGGAIYCSYSSPTIANNALTANNAGTGGAIYCRSSSPEIIDNTINRNSASTLGGGIYCYSSSPAITNNTIAENTTSNGAGGVYCDSSSLPAITGNTISGNTATNLGGGVYCESCATIASNTIAGNAASTGGGVYCKSSSPVIANNTIRANIATGLGGGVYCHTSSSPTIANNAISGNTADSGGGVCCYSSSPAISNNAISGNTASNGGGVWCYSSSSPAISNNTISGNIATSLGGGIYCYTSSPAITNNIVAFNSSGLYKSGSTGTPTLSHNCVYHPNGYNYVGLNAGTNDISVDPQLVGAEYGKVHLKAGSPCIDAGLDSAVQSTWTDMDGETRIQNEHVDIGADEFNGTTPSFVPKIVRVSSSGNDANDGSDWPSAKLTVQAAINAVASAGGGEVWVAAGTYVERITLKQWVHVYGGFAGTEQSRDQRDWIAHVTVLDGNAGGSVVTASALSWGSSTVDGFTIRNGIGTLSSSSRYGGGVYCYYSSPTIANNAITGNTALSGGGGIYCRSSSPAISNNTIAANTAGNGGGGVCCVSSGPAISNNIIIGNTVNGTYGYGGGIYSSSSSSPVISNNTIARNTASGGGGGVYCNWSSPAVSDNIVAFNSSGLYQSGTLGSPTLSHNCVYGNTTYNYSGVANPTGTNGNISVDPRFVNKNAGDYRLAAFSPCIDAGDNSALPAGMLTDLDGCPRFLDDPDTTDTGSGTAPIVDMGAYEFVPVMPGDFNRDGYVDADDVSILRACGTGPSLPYNPSALPDAEPGCTLTPDVNGIIAADFDADGDVDQVDFAALQRCWSGNTAANPACH
jgi:parallel beta-helix repeat protein